MENLPDKNPNEIELKLSEQGYVTLPFSKDDFKDFVVGLLGKPQVIEGVIREPFELDINNIRNIFELIDQRITQQNDGILIQFNARIVFSDDTSVLLNSIEELITYNVIKPVVTEGVHLTFQYLIKFQDKKVPEKQEINISFLTTQRAAVKKIKERFHQSIIIGSFEGEILSGYKTGNIQYNIKHTARTWGTDIESLLVNHLKSLLTLETPLKLFLRRSQSALNTTLFFCVLSLGIVLTKNIHDNIENSRMSKIQLAFKSSNLSLHEISTQIKFLATEGITDQWSIYSLGLLISMVVASVATAVCSSIISEPKHSYLLLSTASIKDKATKEKSYKNQFRNYVLSLLISIAIGLLTNFIYEYISKS